MKIYTNFNLKSPEHSVSYEDIPNKKPWAIFTETIKSFKSHDVVLLTLPSLWHIVSAGLMKILNSKTKLIYWDVVLVPVTSLKTYLLSKIKGSLLNLADCIILVHRDWRGYIQSYGIKSRLLRYVPFTANNIDIADGYKNEDSGYVLSLGLSYRDYNTFFKAVNLCGYPAIIILPQVRLNQDHSTKADLSSAGEKVTVISDDIDRFEWNRVISNAKIVVISIQKNALQPAGISVYLEAMALGKPVIITEGASTVGILDNTMAEIIPPESVKDMAKAIHKLWNDQEYANQIASSGKKYALSLGDDFDLSERLIKVINELE